MVTWICDNCGYEWDLPEGTEPVICPECGAVTPRIKPPPDDPGPKTKPIGG